MVWISIVEMTKRALLSVKLIMYEARVEERGRSVERFFSDTIIWRMGS
jgi:hypothetical protein